MTQGFSSSLIEEYSAIWNLFISSKQQKDIVFPQTIVWLSGAPGAGKGTHLQLILDFYNWQKDAYIGMSDLFNSPEFLAIKNSGALIDDKTAIHLLLNQLIKPPFKHGVVVDGFPRTLFQAEFLVYLFQKINQCKLTEPSTSDAMHFYFLVLNVDENTSVQRQLKRGQEALAKTKETSHASQLRLTDMDTTSARQRYELFQKHTLPAFCSLKDIFPYYCIQAGEAIEIVQEKIKKGLTLLGKP